MTLRPFGLAAALAAIPLLAQAAPVQTPRPAHAPAIAQAQLSIPVDQMDPYQRTAYLRGIQEALNERGYDAGSVDGVMGSRTRAAIRKYQRTAGLPVDGQPTKELLDHILFSGAAQVRTGTSAGTASSATAGTSTGYASPEAGRKLITDVQAELAARGYYTGNLDGAAGPRTMAAVLDFQRDAGVTGTGRIDAALLNQLRTADPSINAY